MHNDFSFENKGLPDFLRDIACTPGSALTRDGAKYAVNGLIGLIAAG